MLKGSASLAIIFEAPSVYYAAAAFIESEVYNGKGDRT
jgi:hypothetical protein